MYRPTVGTATHGDGQAGPRAGLEAAAHHEVNTGQDDVGQHGHSQHSDENKTVDGVDLHTGTSRTPLTRGNSIYIWNGSKVIDMATGKVLTGN